MENTTTVFSLFELFALGGVFMWPLLVFSVAAFAIIIDRAAFLLYHRLRIDKLAAQILAPVGAGKLAEAGAILMEKPARDMGARVLLALVRHAALPETRLEKAVETEAQNCVNALESGFGFLTAIGSLAPLTGFLGTVSGMIGAFRSISEATEVNAQIVANGIYEALITTVFGLIIAIIAMSAHYLLTSVVDRFAVRTEKACSELITALVARAVAARAAARKSDGAPPVSR
jgi:biopolymer transport protein ExbB